MYLSGDFFDRRSCINALLGLQQAEVEPNNIDVFSQQPLELPRSALVRKSHMSLGVVMGAIIFGLLVVGFVYFTQHSYPIITGGMPIFSVWATGVVFYELTMLGAILMSAIWFLMESGLLKRRRRAAPVLEPGVIRVRLHCGKDQAFRLRQILENEGCSNVNSEDEVR